MPALNLLSFRFYCYKYIHMQALFTSFILPKFVKILISLLVNIPLYWYTTITTLLNIWSVVLTLLLSMFYIISTIFLLSVFFQISFKSFLAFSKLVSIFSLRLQILEMNVHHWLYLLHISSTPC